jgi:hypothetical protein
MRYYFHAAILAALFPSVVNANGFAYSDNFIVHTPDHQTQAADQKFAELVLKQAETYRREFAKLWLGAELPAGTGESVISVALSASEDRGLTWAKDHPDRTLHNVYLRTSPENAVGSTLRHEIAHTVLATRFPFPNRLPSWVEEGIASRYDDDSRRAARGQLARYWLRTAQVPRLAQVIETPDLRSFDETSYAAATSLVSFLLTKGNEQKLLRFAVDGQRYGWPSALQAHYRINGYADLEKQWQAWLARNVETDGWAGD